MIETTVDFHGRRPARLRGIVGAGLLALLALPAHAQEEPDAPPQTRQGQIAIPNDVTIYGKGDPNFRKPTVVINGEIITGTDVDQRMAPILDANHNKIAPDEVGRLRLQVLRNLIDETLEIQEAKTAGITVDDDELNANYERVAKVNFHESPAELDAYLAKIGSSPASVKRQIRAEMVWPRLLRKNITPFVNVSEAEVKELLARLQAAKGTEEYRVGEIFLTATSESHDAVLANAKQIVDQLHKGGSFVAYARQYSEASTAVVGGDLGWVRLAQLPPELATTVQGLASGQLAGPLEVRGGFDIVFLRDKRQVLTADPRDAVLALKQVSITLPAGISEAEATRRASDFGTALKAAKGCGTIDAVAAKIGAQVVANDQVAARNLPAALQDTMLKMAPGEMTPPFGSISEGLRVLMLCGRDDPKAGNGPSFDDLMAQMQDDRVNKRAQIYLRDLRRDAIIEYN